MAGSYYLTKECVKSAGGGNFTTCVAVFDDPDVPYTLIEYLLKLVNWVWALGLLSKYYRISKFLKESL